MVVDNDMMESLCEFWNTFNSDGFSRDLICVKFECNEEECFYRIFCSHKEREEKTIGKWCKHYADKLVESLNKENQDEEGN